MTLTEELFAACVASERKINIDRVEHALDFAVMAHVGQKRKSGEDYIIHPIHTALTLTKWNLDTDTIIAGLLHDTIEDGGAKRLDLVKMFGEPVALLVDGVTNISNIRLKGNTQEEFVENLRKMILVMAEDLRVVLVKLADRLHNMRTLEAVAKPKRKRIAQETLEILAPLAGRLGMGFLRSELEDLAFFYVLPKEFRWVKKYALPYFTHGEVVMKEMKSRLASRLNEVGITATIQTRQKHLYSLYQKLLRPEHKRDITQIHDLIALRIIVPSVEDCYTTLGFIHSLYRPVLTLGFRDYIANPKVNGYQSLHTNVFGPKSNITEIQIRTEEMHQEAEMGVAAHWHYTEAKTKGAKDRQLDQGLVPTDKLKWVQQLVSWQKQIVSNIEYFQALKFDALQHRNLVFSPKGDVFDLPRGATPIDYAYAVHSQLGAQIASVKVNGKLVPLDYQLQNGDVVEILVNRKRKHPSADWLQMAVTTSARHHIQHQLKK